MGTTPGDGELLETLGHLFQTSAGFSIWADQQIVSGLMFTIYGGRKSHIQALDSLLRAPVP